MKMSLPFGDKGYGGYTKDDYDATGDSYYHVHYFRYPLFTLLDLLLNLGCTETGPLDLVYLTELDPLWGDDELSAFLNPEALVFGNPLAQAACAADSLKSTIGFGFDSLFWCAGGWGDIMPFTGNASYSSPIQMSELRVARMLAKLHRESLLRGSTGTENLCEEHTKLIMDKTEYKVQLGFPRKFIGLCCNPIGRPPILYEEGATFPMKGEDFVYMVFKKRDCAMRLYGF